MTRNDRANTPTRQSMPQMIYGVTATQDHWSISLLGMSRSISINKPVKDELLGYKYRSGTLTFAPQLNGIGDVPFGFWRLTTPYVKKKGWVLVVEIKDREKGTWQPHEFGFWSRHSGHDLPVAVRRINKRFKATMLRPAKPG